MNRERAPFPVDGGIKMPNQFAHGKQELRPVAQRNKPKVSKPRVSAQGLSTPQGVVPSEEEKKIMPQTEEFEDMVDAVINPNAGVACNKRRLPVFVALTDPNQREFWLKVGSEPSGEH